MRTIALVVPALTPRDTVLHDITVQRELYERAARVGCRQLLVHRFQRNRPDPTAWVARHAPAIERVYLLGEPGRDETAHDVRLSGMPHVVRKLLGTRSPWPPEAGEPRIAAAITHGGYNTVQELARSGVPAVVVPGVRDFDDQQLGAPVRGSGAARR